MSVTANKLIARQEGKRINVPSDTLIHHYQGTAFFITPAGYATNVTGTGANRFGGIVEHECDNSAGLAGALNVAGLADGIYELPGTWTQADVRKPCYAADNYTFSTAWAAGSVRIGTVEELVSSSLARVRIETETKPGLLYAAIAASADVENTTAETAFDKSISLPANSLRVGDVLRVRAAILVTDNNSTNTLTLKLYLGTVAIVSTGAVDVADSDVGYIDVLITVRAIGATGKIAATGVHALGVPGTVTAKPFILPDTTVDTTAANAVQVKATWSAEHADNECNLEVLTVELLNRA